MKWYRPSPHRPHTPLIGITLWVYRRLLWLYPPSFRHEFGTSIIQVIQQSCYDALQCKGNSGVIQLWLPAMVDIVQGITAEYIELLNQSLKGSFLMLQYRRSLSVIFAAFIVFVLAGSGFAKTSEAVMQTSLPTVYPGIEAAYTMLMIGAVVGLVAIIVGGVPLALASLRFAFSHHRNDILGRFAIPPLALLAIIGYTSLIIKTNLGGNTPATLYTPARIFAVASVIVVFIVAAVASTISVLEAIRRSEMSDAVLKFTVYPGGLALLAMFCMVVANIFWNVELWQNAPTHFGGNDGLLATSTVVSMSVQLAAMVIATIVAAIAFLNTISARTATGHLA